MSTAQRYSGPRAHERMRGGLCPECGSTADQHSSDNRFWARYGCSLLPSGVRDRIAQYQADLEPPAPPTGSPLRDEPSTSTGEKP